MEKFNQSIEAFQSVVRKSLEMFLFMFVVFLLVAPERAFAGAWSLASCANFFFSKVIIAYFLVKSRSKIKNIIKNRLAFLKKSSQDQIYGVPMAELLDFIFEKKSFPVKEFLQRFGSNVHTHGKIAQNLSSQGVLVKGEYNRWILDENTTRAKIASILQGRGVRVVVNGQSCPETQDEVVNSLVEAIS